jgi:hypothetical protein
MLLSVALFTLFLLGFWLYCLTDAIVTPAAECRVLRKPTWVAVIAVTFIGGAVAWLIVRRPPRDSLVPMLPLSYRAVAQEKAVARHPAGRGRTTPKGPDDDVDFLRALDRVIRRKPPLN